MPLSKGFVRRGLSGVLKQQNVKVTRAVHTLDSRHLDVGSGGRAGKECEWQRRSRSEAREGFRYVSDDVRGVQDADMDVRHKGGGAAALAGDTFENDCPRFGDSKSPERDRRVEAVELCRREVVVGCDLEAVGQEVRGEVFGDEDAVGVVVLQCLPNCGRDLTWRAGDDVRVVIDQALGEECLGFIVRERGLLGVRAWNLRVIEFGVERSVAWPFADRMAERIAERASAGMRISFGGGL